jgi:multiple sugar transport system permease protein
MSTALRHRLFQYGVVVPFAILLAFPFVWMGVTSLKNQGQVYDPSKVWSFSPTLENYGFLFHHTGYLRWVKNSCFVGLVVVLITLLVAVPAGYALARLSGRLGRSLGVAIFLTYLVPPTLLFLPLSRVAATLHLEDRLWALIVVYPSFTIPFAIWLLMGFFKTIPQELEDAALIDGCSRLGALVRIVFPISIPGILTVVIFTFSLVVIYPSFTIPFAVWLLMGFFKTIPQELEDAALMDGCSRLQALTRIVFPISLPGILTVVIFSFSLVVNEFIYAVTFIATSHQRTLSAGVPTDLVRGDLFNWPSIMAAILIPSIPLALIYNAFLNRFIAGFTGGAFR